MMSKRFSLFCAVWKVTKYRVFSGPYFFRFRTEYGDLWSKSPYSVQKRENTDQKNLRILTLFTQCRCLQPNQNFKDTVVEIQKFYANVIFIIINLFVFSKISKVEMLFTSKNWKKRKIKKKSINITKWLYL